MNLKRKTIPGILAALLVALPSPAFCQGRLHVEARFAGGSSVAEMFVPAMAVVDGLLDSGVRVDSVRVAGWSSPDGSVAANDALGLRRAQALADALRARPGFSGDITVESRGERWEPAERFVSETDDAAVAPVRARMLDIISRESEPDRRLWILRQIGGGRPWSAVEKAVYPSCRMAEADIWYTEPEEGSGKAGADTVVVRPQRPNPSSLAAAALLAGQDTVNKEEPAVAPENTPETEPVKDTLAIAVDEPFPASAGLPADVVTDCRRDWRWQLRTNALLPLLNAGIGVHTGPKGRFSLGADVYYPWLRLAEPKDLAWCCDALAGSLEARWTFRDGADPLRRGTGFSTALVLMAGYYDLGWNYKGIQGEGAAAALDLAWTWAVARGRLRLGLHAAFGGALTQYRNYTVYEGRAYRDGDWSRNMTYLGPLKAEVRIGFPLWHETKITR